MKVWVWGGIQVNQNQNIQNEFDDVKEKIGSKLYLKIKIPKMLKTKDLNFYSLKICQLLFCLNKQSNLKGKPKGKLNNFTLVILST